MNKLKQIVSSLLLIVVFFPALSQEIPERPSPPKLVNDMAGILSNQQQTQLERRLVQFNRETSNQIAIVIVKDLQGYDPGDFAFRLGENWGVGQGKFNNGIVILVKPKTSGSNGRAFIATGYGLEGVVPDAIANRIVNKEMIPHFKKNDYFTGLQQATNTLISLTKGEYTAAEYKEKTQSGEGIPFIFVIIFFAIIFSIFGKRRRHHSSMGGSLPFLLLLGMMGGSRSGQGSFGDFSSGGGDFGGFGGGSFGGGGAGGSW